MKRSIPIFITFVSAVIMIVFYFLNQDIESVKKFQAGILNWVSIIAAFALLLGIFNLLFVNFYKLRRFNKDSIYSLVLIVSFLTITISGLVDDTSATYSWMFENMLRPLSSTMFSLLAFYVASAAFRAFRAKTKEATFLLVAAFIVMLGRVPVGAMIWGKIPLISNWIMAYPAASAQSAIMIGAALGAVSVSLKIILGIEKTYLGGEE
ncbi:MAG: hypothetical protein M0R46_03900 [Candidatus Muirbacterium halophilum]|nr:hypothetical protein [Candidatus Muirbacterium halophilum]MCK9475035.1 hypothetical protein [Candidatus Muirbacterium halophilum]